MLTNLQFALRQVPTMDYPLKPILVVYGVGSAHIRATHVPHLQTMQGSSLTQYHSCDSHIHLFNLKVDVSLLSILNVTWYHVNVQYIDFQVLQIMHMFL